LHEALETKAKARARQRCNQEEEEAEIQNMSGIGHTIAFFENGGIEYYLKNAIPSKNWEWTYKNRQEGKCSTNAKMNSANNVKE
jgi:hypothetical protein